MRERFTLVLKGHIALARVRFPAGTTRPRARRPGARRRCGRTGLDYDHGTGHGVGSYLGVHEGPQRIAKAPNSVALRTGMIVSNEPGYYKDRRLRHPHREPAGGHRGRADPGRRARRCTASRP